MIPRIKSIIAIGINSIPFNDNRPNTIENKAEANITEPGASN